MDAGGGMVDYWAESAGGLGPDVLRVGSSKSKLAKFMGWFPRVLVCFRTSPVWVGFAWAAIGWLICWLGLV